MFARSALLALLTLADPGYPGGIEVHRSECASGDFDWFFFSDGSVISMCTGCETQPHVQQGAWARDGRDIVVKLKQEWFGYGRGQHLFAASVDIWSDYVALTRIGGPNGLGLEQRFRVEEFTADGKDDCSSARKHARPNDPHAFLRQFEGDHPETHQRLLEPGELQKLGREQLGLMRNEVFARYGFRFKDPSLVASFGRFKDKGYRPNLSNVDDFLSDLERENLVRLIAAEAGAAARRVGRPTDDDVERQLGRLATRVASGQGRGAWAELQSLFPEPERLRGCADEVLGLLITDLLAHHWDLLGDLGRIAEEQPAWLDAALAHLGGVEGLYLREVEEHARRCSPRQAAMCRRILEVAQAHRKAIEDERRTGK